MSLKNLILNNISYEEYLNYNNIIVEEIYIPYQNIRGFVENYKGLYYIYINKNIGINKKKTTLLHELAHIELSQLCQIGNDLFAFHIDDYEDEADKYLERLKQEIVLINNI